MAKPIGGKIAKAESRRDWEDRFSHLQQKMRLPFYSVRLRRGATEISARRIIMNVGKVILGVGTAVGLLSSTVAIAAPTRSAAALPSLQTSLAPVNGLRTATPTKRKSAQSDGSAAGTYIVGGLAAAAVIAGIIVVASDNNNNPSSGG